MTESGRGGARRPGRMPASRDYKKTGFKCFSLHNLCLHTHTQKLKYNQISWVGATREQIEKRGRKKLVEGNIYRKDQAGFKGVCLWLRSEHLGKFSRLLGSRLAPGPRSDSLTLLLPFFHQVSAQILPEASSSPHFTGEETKVRGSKVPFLWP